MGRPWSVKNERFTVFTMLSLRGRKPYPRDRNSKLTRPANKTPGQKKQTKSNYLNPCFLARANNKPVPWAVHN
jgi:hypothetical protein